LGLVVEFGRHFPLHFRTQNFEEKEPEHEQGVVADMASLEEWTDCRCLVFLACLGHLMVAAVAHTVLPEVTEHLVWMARLLAFETAAVEVVHFVSLPQKEAPPL